MISRQIVRQAERRKDKPAPGPIERTAPKWERRAKMKPKGYGYRLMHTTVRTFRRHLESGWGPIQIVRMTYHPTKGWRKV